MRFVVRALLAVLFAVVALAGAADPPSDLHFNDMQGQSQSLADYRGKVVVLNFWATWCGPCRDEMPLLVEAQKKYADKLTVIALSLDDKETGKKIEKFVKKQKMTFPVWLGGTPETLKQFEVGEALPATLFIDENGKVVSRVLGQIKKKDLYPRLEWLMSDRSAPAPAPLVNNLK